MSAFASPGAIRSGLAVTLIALLFLTGQGSAQGVPADDVPAIAAPLREAPVQPVADALPVLPGAEGPVERVSPAPVTNAAPAHAPHSLTPGPDLTTMGMYRAAHPVVKAVMIVLALATIASWTVFLFKSFEIAIARARTARSCRVLEAAATLDEAAGTLGRARDPAACMARFALLEARLSAPALAGAGSAGLKERVRSLLQRTDAAAAGHLRRGTGLLATIGAIAPFVGLFGTVWGIMNAFVGIAESKSSNLAVVAPGIAEALLATALGLVAAIPAVVIYNIFSRSIAAYRVLLGDAAASIERLVSRDLDFGRRPFAAEV